MIPFEKLPTLNALLNSLAAVCLLFGWWAIRRGQKERHKYFMVSAVVLSTMFLVSYLTYHHFVGVTRFQGEGVIRGIYFFILGTHTPLAALIFKRKFCIPHKNHTLAAAGLALCGRDRGDDLCAFVYFLKKRREEV